jgi:hypothetical protein
MVGRNRVGIVVSYGPPGFIGRRNRFLGIDSWASSTFTNSGSVHLGLAVDVETPWAGEVEPAPGVSVQFCNLHHRILIQKKILFRKTAEEF